MKNLHRDLFVGEVAEEMNKQGVFGSEINLYCFLYWDGNNILDYCCENEYLCVKKALNNLQQGFFVSDYNILKRRIFVNKTQALPQLLQDIREQIYQERLSELEEKIAEFKKRNYAAGEEKISKFLQDMADEQKPIINDLLGRCLQIKTISKNFYDKFYCPITKDFSLSDGEAAGFAWLENGKINYYVNAYLPTVWKKLCIKQKQSLCSSIYTLAVNIEQNFTAIKAKDKLKELLPAVFTEEYFTLLKEIEAK